MCIEKLNLSLRVRLVMQQRDVGQERNVGPGDWKCQENQYGCCCCCCWVAIYVHFHVVHHSVSILSLHCDSSWHIVWSCLLVGKHSSKMNCRSHWLMKCLIDVFTTLFSRYWLTGIWRKSWRAIDCCILGNDVLFSFRLFHTFVSLGCETWPTKKSRVSKDFTEFS